MFLSKYTALYNYYGYQCLILHSIKVLNIDNQIEFLLFKYYIEFYSFNYYISRENYYTMSKSSPVNRFNEIPLNNPLVY